MCLKQFARLAYPEQTGGSAKRTSWGKILANLARKLIQFAANPSSYDEKFRDARLNRFREMRPTAVGDGIF